MEQINDDENFTIKDTTITVKSILQNDNLNNYKSNGRYYWFYAPINAPRSTNNGTMFVTVIGNLRVIQIVFTAVAIYYRSSQDGGVFDSTSYWCQATLSKV